MLTSKQRAYLKGLSNEIKPIFQIGKGGINDMLVKQINEALKKREIVKVHVLQSALLTSREALFEIAELTESEPVFSVGNNFVLYKKPAKGDKKEPIITLP